MSSLDVKFTASTSQRTNYTCIIPWSGGVESTALICHAIDQGEVPFVFHLVLNGHWENQIHAVSKMSEAIGLPLHFIRVNKSTSYVDYEKTKSHYEQGYPPMFINWVNHAQMIHFQNPFIDKIWYGFNADGDVKTPAWHALEKSVMEVAKLQGIPVDMRSPLGHLPKHEQYKLIWEELLPHVVTCVDVHNPTCGKCMKCKEFQEMLKKV